MRKHYTNTVSTVILLFSLFISSALSSSSIRQYTDDFTTKFQQDNGGGLIPVQGEAHYLGNDDQEISSREHKVSSPYAVKGLRRSPPSTYSLKMESFNTLLESTNVERYVSRPFAVAGHTWTLVVYPNGNKNDNGAGFLSLYVAFNSTLSVHQPIDMDVRFYVFNNVQKKYFTIQDTDGWRFSNFRRMLGFSQVLPLYTFKDPNKGYLYDGGNCEFGVDVTVPTTFKQSELFTVTDKFDRAHSTWTIPNISNFQDGSFYGLSFAGRNWGLFVYPNGHGTGKGKAFSMYLSLGVNNRLRPYEKMYVRAKLQVLNQRFSFNNAERLIDDWFSDPGNEDTSVKGSDEILPLSDLYDSSKGFLVNDRVRIGVEFEAISSTKYLP